MLLQDTRSLQVTLKSPFKTENQDCGPLEMTVGGNAEGREESGVGSCVLKWVLPSPQGAGRAPPVPLQRFHLQSTVRLEQGPAWPSGHLFVCPGCWCTGHTNADGFTPCDGTKLRAAAP